jgi:hypothetical protein
LTKGWWRAGAASCHFWKYAASVSPSRGGEVLSHHPHGLDDPTPVVEFILKHTATTPASK